MLEQIYYLLGLSLAVASISWTFTQEDIFYEPRKYCSDRSKSDESLLLRKLFYIPTCEYCFSHWVTLFILLITGYRFMYDDFRGYFLAFFVLPWVANQWMSLYRRIRVEIKHENILATKEKKKLPKSEENVK
jgi:hypothetical protein